MKIKTKNIIKFSLTLFILLVSICNIIYTRPIDLTTTIPYLLDEDSNKLKIVQLGNYTIDIYGQDFEDYEIFDYDTDYKILNAEQKYSITSEIFKYIPNCLFIPYFQNKDYDILGIYINKNDIKSIELQNFPGKDYYNGILVTDYKTINCSITEDTRKYLKAIDINIIISEEK